MDTKVNFKKTIDTLNYRIYGYLTTCCYYYTDDPILRGLRLKDFLTSSFCSLYYTDDPILRGLRPSFCSLFNSSHLAITPMTRF